MNTLSFLLVLAVGCVVGKMVAKKEKDEITKKFNAAYSMEKRAKKIWQDTYYQEVRIKEQQEKEIEDLKAKLEKYEMTDKYRKVV